MNKDNMNDTNNKILKNKTSLQKDSKMSVLERIKNKIKNSLKEPKSVSNNISGNVSEINESKSENKSHVSQLENGKKNLSRFYNDSNNNIINNNNKDNKKEQENLSINIEEINRNTIKKQNSKNESQVKKFREKKDLEENISNIDINFNNKKDEEIIEEENKQKEKNENMGGTVKSKQNSQRSKKGENKMDLNKMIEDLENKLNEKQKKPNLINNMIEITKKSDNRDNIQFQVMSIGLLIEGDSISHCLDDDLKDIFWTIVKNSKSVVCCRCSPKQKAEVVGFVKNVSGEITLAIGDGGNDIPMIKMADIGCGIFGKEGYQAAFNSDFAFTQFKYLKRLIYNHGRLSLLRNSYFVYFFFFKNVIFTLTQLWFCFFSGFSGQVYIYIFIIFIFYYFFSCFLILGIYLDLIVF